MNIREIASQHRVELRALHRGFLMAIQGGGKASADTMPTGAERQLWLIGFEKGRAAVKAGSESRSARVSEHDQTLELAPSVDLMGPDR